MNLSNEILKIADEVNSSTLEEDIKDEISLTRDKGKWIAWYRGKKINTNVDLKKIQNIIDKFVKKMVKDIKENTSSKQAVTVNSKKEYEMTYINKRDGVMLFIKKLKNDKYSVGIKDLDANEILDTIKIFSNIEKATKYFNDTKKKMR